MSAPNTRRTSAAQRWPGDPAGLTAAGIDFGALAHVLANTCRWGGRTQRFYSVAQRAVAASEAIDALDGLAPEERRTLALRALLADARVAWLGDAEAGGPASARAAERRRRDGAAIDRAVLEAAGIDGAPSSEQDDLLRFVARMTDAAERRDLPDAGITRSAGVAFPPLKRRIRPVEPGRAARLWLKRFRELAHPPTNDGADADVAPAPTDRKENPDVPQLAKPGKEKPQHEANPGNEGRPLAA